MPSRAKSCAILNTKLLVTSAGRSKSEVHRTILLALTNALNQSKFIESIPNLTTTSYLGPDPESMTLSSESLVAGMGVAGGRTTASVIAISIGCSLLLLISALCLIFRRISTHEEKEDGSIGPVSHTVVNKCLRVDSLMNAVRKWGWEKEYITFLVKHFHGVHFVFYLTRDIDKKC